MPNSDSEGFSIHLRPEDLELYRQIHEHAQQDASLRDSAEKRVVNTGDHNDLKAHMIESHDWAPEDYDFDRSTHGDHPVLGEDPQTEDELTHPELKKMHDWEHETYEDFPDASTMGESHFHTASLKTAQPGSSSRNSDSEDRHTGRETASCKVCGSDIYKVKTPGVARPWVHDIDAGSGGPHQAMPENELEVRVQVEAAKAVKDMTPQEYAVYQRAEIKKNKAGRSWLRKNPATINNVVDHWNKATDDEKDAGMTWYGDAAHAAKVIGDATGVGHSAMAGLIANYSPQAPWHQNLMYAIRSATEGKGIGGKGSGVMATASRADHADKILSGKHWKDVLGASAGATFSLKTRAFASLIEHGGDHDESNPQVCIDRHALSVVHGARLTDRAYKMSGIAGKGRYADYSTQYVKAAKKISKQVGYKVHPHQVQAATWLARQRMNEEEDRANGKESNSSKQAAKAKEHYDNYMGENHPELIIPEPGTGYSKRSIEQLPEDVKDAYDLRQEFHGTDSGEPQMKAESVRVDMNNFAEYSQDTTVRDYRFAPWPNRHGYSQPKEGVLMKNLAYGETKAPAQVDTLRDDSCPICSESNSYDGNQCKNCGYVAPPSPFGDPDTSVAKEMDLRQDNLDQQDPNQPIDPSMIADPDPNPGVQEEQDALAPEGEPEDGRVKVDIHTLDNSTTPQADGEYLPSEAYGEEIGYNNLDANGQPIAPQDDQEEAPINQEPIDPELLQDPNQESLICPVCGLNVPTAHPFSEGDQQNTPDSDNAGFASGQMCPNCGQALLMPSGSI